MTNNEIKELFEKYKIEVTTIQKANNSYSSNVYIIFTKDNKYILKITKDKEKRLNEKKYYNYLYQYVLTAKVLYSSTYKGNQYNIISFLEGKNIYDEKCNELSTDEIYSMGKLLASIHNCPLVSISDDSWIAYLKSYLEKADKELKNLFGRKDNKLIVDFLENFITKKIKPNYKNSLLHMDYRVGNIIIDENQNAGIIDLESMKNGDYVFDFVKMNRIFDKDNFNVFLKGYQSIREINSDFNEKLKFYSFFDSYTSLLWCYVNNQKNSDFYNLNYSIVNQYLEDLKNGRWTI